MKQSPPSFELTADDNLSRAALFAPAESGALPRAIRLPALIRRSPSGMMYWLYWTPFILIYQIVNRWPIFPPVELSFSRLDDLIPFVPGLLPVYVAYIPFYWLTACRSENDREANRLFYAAHLQLLLSLPFFIFMPVKMPRELFYAPATYGFIDAFWRWFDGPNNCFPSLHVSNCLLLAHFNRRRAYSGFFVFVSLAIIASTVFVKQHYVVDLLGGVAVYLVSCRFLRRLCITGLTEDGRRAALAGARRV